MKELINLLTMRLIIFSFSFFLFLNYSCDSAEASTSNQDAVDAFKRVGSKDKKLFTQKDRVASYKSSLETGKSSLNKNEIYTGYGSSAKKINNKEKSVKEKKGIKSKYSLKKRKNKSSNNFSAYTTN